MKKTLSILSAVIFLSMANLTIASEPSNDKAQKEQETTNTTPETPAAQFEKKALTALDALGKNRRERLASEAKWNIFAALGCFAFLGAACFTTKFVIEDRIRDLMKGTLVRRWDNSPVGLDAYILFPTFWFLLKSFQAISAVCGTVFLVQGVTDLDEMSKEVSLAQGVRELNEVSTIPATEKE